jgi:hypothetical protein
MREERLEVSVTFDERHGYVASAPELRTAVVALSLGGLRRKIEIAMLPDDIRVVLQLDGLAERDSPPGAAQVQLSRIAQLPGPMSALGGSGRAVPKEEVCSSRNSSGCTRRNPDSLPVNINVEP